MRRRTLALAACLAIAAAAATRPASAASYVAVSVEEVARTSDAVVLGHVTSIEPRATKDGRIVTEVEVAVDEAWKGAPDATVRLVVPGGALPDLAMHVDAAPTFAKGEQVVVFATRRGRAWHVNGLGLGKFRVVGPDVQPSLETGVALPRALPAGERQVGPMSVAELERRVKAAR